MNEKNTETGTSIAAVFAIVLILMALYLMSQCEAQAGVALLGVIN